jgi:hypothetical protein
MTSAYLIQEEAAKLLRLSPRTDLGQAPTFDDGIVEKLVDFRSVWPSVPSSLDLPAKPVCAHTVELDCISPRLGAL